MTTTILDDLVALMDLRVQHELLRLSEPPCDLCSPGKPCWWHRTWKDRDRKICDANGGESAS